MGTKSSLGLDQRKLATLYTVMMYVASCTVQCTATSQAPFYKVRMLQKCCHQSITSLVPYMGQKRSQTKEEASKKQKGKHRGP